MNKALHLGAGESKEYSPCRGFSAAQKFSCDWFLFWLVFAVMRAHPFAKPSHVAGDSAFDAKSISGGVGLHVQLAVGSARGIRLESASGHRRYKSPRFCRLDVMGSMSIID